MANEPIITTLIPTYRRAALLERAIRSALAQTYPHLQVCVYDNASGDDTEGAVRRLSSVDQRVKYFCHATNIGAQKNFIQAMERVDTPLFSFLSDDDILLPHFYETALDGLRKYPEAMMSATITLRMSKTGRILDVPLHRWKPGVYLPPHGLLSMLSDVHPDWTSVVFRQDVLRKVGALDEETGALSDLDYMLRVAAKFPIVVSAEPGAIFVVHAEGYSSTSKAYTPNGWAKMIANQTSDNQIPVMARTYAKTVLTKRLTQRIFLVDGFYSILARRWDDSHEAANILRRDYGLWARAAFLSAASWICEHLPLARHALVMVFATKHFFTRLGLRPLQKDFGSYAKYL